MFDIIYCNLNFISSHFPYMYKGWLAYNAQYIACDNVCNLIHCVPV